MARVRLSQFMSRLFPEHQGKRIPANHVAELLDKLDKETPGLNEFLRNSEGVLRDAVDIIVNGKSVKDRQQLSDSLDGDTEILIVQQER